MNLKTISTCLSVCALFAQCMTPLPTYAAQPAGLSGAYRGGQAPPAAVGGSGDLSVVVAAKLPQATANTLRAELIEEDFSAAESRPAGDGTYDVVIGGLASRADADDLMSKLRSSGYTPAGIVENTAAASAPEQSVFRVQVAEFSSAAEANGASEVLADEGFVNVDVVQENDRHILMLGTFNRRADAEALLTQVNEAGFALASVVNRDRLHSTSAANPANADLSGLSQTEQAQTRNVLAMAEKVSSGEASADEVQQLRDTIQQLPENQKAIVSREETNRSASREKMQQIFSLYRNFERAMADGNFDNAEKFLAEVRQIDPNDIYLASRVKALAVARSGGSQSGAGPASATPASTGIDPAQVQQLLNAARASESSGNSNEALQSYQQVLALDPTNSEARSKVAALGEARAPASTESAGGMAAILENKPLLYGAAGAVALIIILLLWVKSRGRKNSPIATSSSSGLNSGPDFIDPLAPSGGYNQGANPTPLTNQGNSFTANPTPAAGSAMAGAAGMADFTLMDESEDEEEPLIKAPAPAPRPPVTEENDMVSMEAFESEPEITPAPVPSDDIVSINFDEEPVLPTAAPVLNTTPAKGTSSMDADLEALLRGTFGGTESQSEMVPESLEPAVTAAGAAASAEQLIYQQNFNDEAEGSSPKDWRGEYDYSTLSVANLGESDHAKCLMFEKIEGVGSATYHLSFPPAKGRVVVEFDVRCDEKNKFLLGIYLEKDEDFKQSVHTIVHQLDPGGPASLRVQGEAVPYRIGSWCHMRYEIDLIDGLLNAFIDEEHIVKESKLPVAPDYFNTLSIRDNLATTGTLYLDNIRISEA